MRLAIIWNKRFFLKLFRARLLQRISKRKRMNTKMKYMEKDQTGKKADGRQSGVIKDFSVVKIQSSNKVNFPQRISLPFLASPVSRRDPKGNNNAIWSQQMGKAPPGRCGSRGTRGSPYSDHPPDDAHKCIGKFYSVKNQSIGSKLIISFTNILNFKIMKKQILSLAIFTLALIFAGTSNSFGQCEPGPLSPAPGVEYSYGVTLTGAIGNATYRWYVTEDTDLMTGVHTAIGTYFTLGPTAGSTYDALPGAATINLVWTPASIGKTFYLVVHATADGVVAGVACTVENRKVYEIKAVNTFLLAIVGSDIDGNAANSEVCAANITSAVVSTTGPSVTYLYGQNTLYYKVTASGIIGNWQPSIQLPALIGAANGQNYVSAEWTPIGTSTWTTFGLTAGNTTGGNFTSTTDATVTNVSGSDIIVKIVIDNVRYETLSNQAITLGVDGLLPSAYTESDIVGGTGPTACNPEAPFGKTGTSTITLRPTVTPVAPNTFIAEVH
jgi:hypothetical protein